MQSEASEIRVTPGMRARIPEASYNFIKSWARNGQFCSVGMSEKPVRECINRKKQIRIIFRSLLDLAILIHNTYVYPEKVSALVGFIYFAHLAV